MSRSAEDIKNDPTLTDEGKVEALSEFSSLPPEYGGSGGIADLQERADLAERRMAEEGGHANVRSSIQAKVDLADARAQVGDEHQETQSNATASDDGDSRKTGDWELLDDPEGRQFDESLYLNKHVQ